MGAARAPNIENEDEDDDEDDGPIENDENDEDEAGPALKEGLLYIGAASRCGRLPADCRPACSLT